MLLRHQIGLILSLCLAIASFLSQFQDPVYKFGLTFAPALFDKFALVKDYVKDKKRVGIIFEYEAIIAVTGRGILDEKADKKYRNLISGAISNIAQSALVPTIVENEWADGDVLGFWLSEEYLKEFCKKHNLEVKKSFDNQIIVLGKPGCSQ